MTYYIVIDLHGNANAADYFTLSASTSTIHDQFEPNENAFYALQFPDVVVPFSITVSMGLNTPIDNDWFCLNLADTSEIAGLDISGIPSSVVVESYRVTGDNQMIKMGSTLNGVTLPIAQGYTYFRICSNRTGAFTPGTYELKFNTALKAKKTRTLIAVNGYCQRSSSNFNDGIMRRLFIAGSNVEVRVMYLTADDYLAKVTNDTVNVEIDNPNWSNPSMRYAVGANSVSDANINSVFLEAPLVYDINIYDMVYTTITSQNFGTIAGRVPMALLDGYGDGETSRPCIHNGSCGFK